MAAVAAVFPVAGSAASSIGTISTLRPRRPPRALIWLAASFAPSSMPMPMLFWSPVSGASRPIRTVEADESAATAAGAASAASDTAATSDARKVRMNSDPFPAQPLRRRRVWQAIGTSRRHHEPPVGSLGYKGTRTIDEPGDLPWPWRRPITTPSSPPTRTPARTTRRTASTSTDEYLADFDAWREKYKNPWKDLRDTSLRVRNWDNERRNADQDADGVVGEVVFPNTVPPFFPSFVLFARPPKPEDYAHRRAGMQAHNRWLVDFCALHPERRAGIGQIFLNDVDDAIEDAKWIKEHGLRGGVLLPNIAPDVKWVKPLYDPYYDPLWAVLEDMEIPVNAHGGTGSPDYGRYASTPMIMICEVAVLLAAPVRAHAALRRVRAVPAAEVRDDRDGRGVDPAAAQAARRDHRQRAQG